MVLLYSNRAIEEIIFRDHFEGLAAKGNNFKVVFSLDTPGQCPIDWRGHCGYIDAAMIRKEIPDYQERIFYVCGPTVMVKKMVEILKGELLVAEENIRRENISGYETV
jgi:ferredoxin-NADP reductase